jgi:hypothetical protein
MYCLQEYGHSPELCTNCFVASTPAAVHTLHQEVYVSCPWDVATQHNFKHGVPQDSR